jgi:hypothetical protein
MKENVFSNAGIEHRNPRKSFVANCQSMDNAANGRSRRRFWKGALFALVVLPFLPEILILTASAYAGAIGCQIDSKMACAVGPPSASEVIRTALQAAYSIGSQFADDNIVVAWLVLCFVLIIFGWSRLSSRLLLALGVSLIFGFLPYFAPILSIGHLENPKCHPNEGGVPPECTIYGGDVGNAAHDAVRLGWKFFYGAPVALGAFVVFVILALGARLVSRRRMASQAQGAPPAA